MTGFTTNAIHAVSNNEYEAIMPPIHLATTFGQPTDGTAGPYEYQRGGSPTRSDLEQALATIEDAKHAFAYPSGMGASAAAMGILNSGENLILGMPSYGGNYRFATVELPKRGVGVRFVGDFSTLSDEDFADNVKMVFWESPTNPTLQVSDIAQIAEIAHRNGALLVVDNTFMTPYLQRPLDLGADITVQSATKYLGGHGDLLAGVAATNNDELATELWRAQLINGSVLSPIDSYRLLQNIKTLALRLDRQQENAQKIIEFLQDHPKVQQVLYAGGASDEQAEIQARQARGNGAVFSIKLIDTANIKAFLDALTIFDFAVSLGGIESLICLPATMTQEAYTQEHLDEFGVDANLIRLAIGIEDAEDLIADLDQALAAA